MVVVVVVAPVTCRPRAWVDTESIWADVSLGENPGMAPWPFVTIDTIWDNDNVLACNDGPIPPSPLAPWQAAHSAA